MTRDEFQAIYQRGPDATFALIESLLQRLDILTTRIQELESRLKKDSHNSSKPPASDGLAKKTKSLRHRTGNPPGGQPGHPGATLCLVDIPDQVVQHHPQTCSSCGACLEGAPVLSKLRRQVHDLPPLALQVTEHQALCQLCPACQTKNQAAFPEEVAQPVQYGPCIKALCVYLQQYQLLPFERTHELLSDLLGGSLCAGTLARLLGVCHERLAGVESAIKQALVEASVVHFDETGLRIAQRTHWLHSASTTELTFYAHHEKRGKAATDAIGILPSFTGTSVHDAWTSYFGYSGCKHALCNAHLLRELTFIHEQMHQPWAAQMIELLLAMKQAVEAAKSAGDSCLSEAALADLLGRYQALLRDALAANAASEPPPKQCRRGRPRQSAAKNLLDRLRRYQWAVLAFLFDFAVPFDNNLAERDLRMSKVRQKISGCFRSAQGASQFCRIRGYISTLRKQGIHVLTALRSVFEGKPVMPALQPE